MASHKSETLLACFPSGTQSFQVHIEGVLMPLFPFSPSSGAASWALGTTCHQTPLVSGQRQSGKLLWFFSLFPHWIVVMSHLELEGVAVIFFGTGHSLDM